jgi:hypothetical protein
MLHWYRLAKSTLRSHDSERTAHPALVAHSGGSLTSSLTRQQQAKLFWLGLAESVPLFSGGIFSIYAQSVGQVVVAAALAILGTSIVCWFLRHQVPLTRIELASQTKRSNQALQPTAGRSDV